MKTNNAVSNEDYEAARRFQQALESKPVEEQLAVSLIAKNVINGCSWEFVRANPQLRRNKADFDKSPYCSIQEVTYSHSKKIYGYLVYMQMSRLLELLGPQNNGPLSNKDVEIASQHRKEAGEAFIKRLGEGYQGKIGIFCTNDSQTISIQGKTYPAYAVTLKEACSICEQMGYGIVVSGEPRNPQQVLQREDAVLKSLVVAPSSNALFIEVGKMKKR